MRKSIFIAFVFFTLFASALFSANLKIQYRDGDHGNATDNHIKPHLNIINQGSDTVAMSGLTLRYYYTKEGTANEVLYVDYAYIGSSCITGTFHDGYLEIGFTGSAGNIPGYGSSGEIQLRFNKMDWSNYNETDDYSYISAAVFYTDWEKVTLYLDGTLIWGQEPCGPTGPPLTPEPEPTPGEPEVLPFVESGGLVVMEAEHFTALAPGKGWAAYSSWEESSNLADSSNGSALKAVPNRGINVKDTTNGPRLDYDVQFETTGTYYLWVRMWGPSYGDDSLHAGLDGEPASFGKSGLTITSYTWKWVDTAATRVTVDIETPGLHTVNIWMREDGTRIDKILLTTDPDFVPQGQGPEESLVETPPAPTPAAVTPEPGTPEPTPEPVPGAGKVWVVPAEITTSVMESFTVEIHVNSGNQTISAYQFTLTYDGAVLMVDTDQGTDGVDTGSDGFVAAVNAQTPGILIFNGFDVGGTGPGEDLHIVTLHFTALDTGGSPLSLAIDSLADDETNTVGIPEAIDGFVTVSDEVLTPSPTPGITDEPPTAIPTPSPTPLSGETATPAAGALGDVNGDGVIDIVDALMCAQYYVGLGSSNFDVNLADVNYDGEINIIDALYLAQYYVGLIGGLPGPDPTPEGEPTPEPEPGAGNMCIAPEIQEVNVNSEFVTEIHVNTGLQSLAAFGIKIIYESQYVSVDTGEGTRGVERGPDGINITAVNPDTIGELTISAMEPYGVDPGTDLHILTIHWISGGKAGTTPLEIIINDLVDTDGSVIGVPGGTGGTVTITGAEPSPTPVPGGGGGGSNTGDAWYVPTRQVVFESEDVQAELHLNSGDQRIAAYGLDIIYDDDILSFLDLEEGPDGFVSAYSRSGMGLIRVSGFDAKGTGPGPNLHLLTIYFDPFDTGTSALGLEVDSLADPDTNNIGSPNGIPGEIIIIPETPDVSLKAQYRCGEDSALTDMIHPYFNLVNNGTQNVTLSDVTLRYYYSKDGAEEEVFTVIHAEAGDSAVTGTIFEDYLQIEFTEEAGILEPLEETGEILCGVQRPDQNPYDQTYDYSFDPDYLDYADYRNVALFIGDSLVWGSVPAFPPEPNPTPETPTPTRTPAPTQAPTYTPGPTSIPTEEPPPGTGDVWFVPDTITVDEGAHFETEIHVNAGNQAIGAYGFHIYFDNDVVQVNIDEGTEGVEPGPDGYVAVVNSSKPGELIFAGYSTSGKGTGTDVNFVKVNWVAAGPGTSTLELTVNVLTDERTDPIGTPNGIDGQVTVITTTPTPDPTPTPEPTEVPEPVEGAGDVWFSPSSQAVNAGDLFTTEIHINSGYQTISTVGFDIIYDPDILEVNTSAGNNGVEPGPDGFIAIVNPDIPGTLKMSGVHDGFTAGTDLHFLTVYWKAKGEGTTPLDLSIGSLTDAKLANIGTPNAIDGTVEVTSTGETPEPTPETLGAGNIWIVPGEQVVDPGDACEVEIHANTGDYILGAYGFELEYNETVITVNTGIGTNGVEPGADGFISAVNASTPGLLICAGFDATGAGPGSDLHLVTIHFTAVEAGTSQLTLSVDTLVDLDTNTIGIPNGIGGTIQVAVSSETPEPSVEPSVEPTPVPTVIPTSVPTPTPTTGPTETPPEGVQAGTVWFVPENQTVEIGNNFTTEIHIHTGTQALASYGIDIYFDETIIIVDTSTGSSGVEAGPDGFVAAINPNNPGLIKTSGFDISGTGPGSDLNVLIVNWTAVSQGTTELTLDIRTLVDLDTNDIGTPTGKNGTVTVN